MKRETRRSKCTALEELGAPFEAVRAQTGNRRVGGAGGWLRTVRQVEAVPLKKVAGRLGVLKREILRLEVAEESGQITLKRMREVAQAMDCEVVYAFLAKERTLEELAQQMEAAKKEKQQERMRTRERKEFEKRRKRYGDASVLKLLALEVERELRRMMKGKG